MKPVRKSVRHVRQRNQHGQTKHPQFDPETGQVRSQCPNCDGALTTFESGDAKHGEFGSITQGKRLITVQFGYPAETRPERVYKLLRCAGCGRGGLATIRYELSEKTIKPVLSDFYPASRQMAQFPENVPEKIVQEYREAEICSSAGALRAASALLRSTLEKLLRANGYEKGNLKDRIDEAATEGIITEALKQRAHDNVRDLGNDVLHDEWRSVDPGEYTSAHGYVQRIIEFFYDSRTQVEGLLKKANRAFEKVVNP